MPLYQFRPAATTSFDRLRHTDHKPNDLAGCSRWTKIVKPFIVQYSGIQHVLSPTPNGHHGSNQAFLYVTYVLMHYTATLHMRSDNTPQQCMPAHFVSVQQEVPIQGVI
jgi:hypothetical protein